MIDKRRNEREIRVLYYEYLDSEYDGFTENGKKKSAARKMTRCTKQGLMFIGDTKPM